MSKYYYINLDRRTDRKDAFERTWLTAIPEIERHSAYESTVPHLGCGVSHVDAAERGFAAGHRVVAVLEDDAVPAEGPDAVKALVAEAEEFYNVFDVIYLGASIEYRRETLTGMVVSQSFVGIAPTRDITATTGMIFSIRARSRLQDYKRQQLTGCVIPCDRFFSGKTWGPFSWSPFTAWITKDYILAQRESYSDNVSCVTSPTTALYPLPPLTNTPVALSDPAALSLKTGILCVSAFFPIASKAPPDYYFALAKRLLGATPVPFVLFTTEACKPVFAAMRPAGWPLHVHCLPLGSDGLPKDIPTRGWLASYDWVRQSRASMALSGGRNITSSLLQLWLSKGWFVQEAIRRGHTADFLMWCDIGSHKVEHMGATSLRWWPAVGPLYDLVEASGKVEPMICFQRKEPKPVLSLPNNCFTDSQNPAGHLISTPVGWSRFSDHMKESLYDLQLNAPLGFVWANDETVLAHAIQLRPAHYITIPSWRTPLGDPPAWFPSFMFLSERWKTPLPTDSPNRRSDSDPRPKTFLKRIAARRGAGRR